MGGDVRVGRGGLVGGTDVRVGRGVLVGGGKGVLVVVGRESRVLAVKVMTGRGVNVRVGVRVGVRLGVNVADGTMEGVAVGAMDVGNGPNRDCEVSARAVRVPRDVRPASRPPGEISKMLERPTIKPIIKRHTNKAFKKIGLLFQKFTLCSPDQHRMGPNAGGGVNLSYA